MRVESSGARRLAAAAAPAQAAARERLAPLLSTLKDYDSAQATFHRSHLHLAAVQLQRVGATLGTGGTSFKHYLAKYEREVQPLFEGLA